MKRLPRFDKYEHYFRSVQDPEQACDFVERAYARAFKTEPVVFGEDFCGTFAMSCSWVERGPKRRAIAVDLSTEPLTYGMRHYFGPLKQDEQDRLIVYKSDVRHPKLPKVDVLAAFNFSYFAFKKRDDLRKYFRNCRRRMKPKGLFVLDIFGGTTTVEPNLDVSRFGDFTYYWDQVSFDPISHEALFYIHYKRDGEKRRDNVFRYDWRMWSIPEVQEILVEAGFGESQVYWEGTNPKGDGTGKFHRKLREENCQAWLAYITATV